MKLHQLSQTNIYRTVNYLKLRPLFADLEIKEVVFDSTVNIIEVPLDYQQLRSRIIAAGQYLTDCDQGHCRIVFKTGESYLVTPLPDRLVIRV